MDSHGAARIHPLAGKPKANVKVNRGTAPRFVRSARNSTVRISKQPVAGKFLAVTKFASDGQTSNNAANASKQACNLRLHTRGKV